MKKVKDVKFQNLHSGLCQQTSMYFYDSYIEEDSVSIQDKQNVSQNIEKEHELEPKMKD